MNIIKRMILFICLPLMFGIIFGFYWGDSSLKSAGRGSISAATVLFMPPADYAKALRHLTSNVLTERITGYYMLVNSGDFELLHSRYIKENTEIAKKVIIWIAEQQNDKNIIAEFYDKIYSSGNSKLKSLIRRNLLNSRDRDSEELLKKIKENGE